MDASAAERSAVSADQRHGVTDAPPAEHVELSQQALEAEGHDILGYYHSHPDHPSRYSEYDRDHALPNMSYLIVSVLKGEVVDTASWRLHEDRSAMSAEPIIVI